MMGSDEVAHRMYAELGTEARAAVDSWRGLGVDMTTALLNSGALGGRRYQAGEPDDWHRRKLNPDDVELQSTCEHEAAHAVVARALGLGPVVAVINEDGRSGVTSFRSTSPFGSAMVAAAAEVWITEFRHIAFPGARQREFSHDRLMVVRNTTGDMQARDTYQRAREILAEHREEVLAAAHQLRRAGRLALD
ncbi:hypothetical protein ACWGB8_17325 [Kitasatospora sp. NPDC054939]